MTNSVLCAVDVSNGDDDINVIQTAARLARLDDATLDFIAVIPDFGMSQVGTFFSSDHHEKMEAEAKEQLKKALIEYKGSILLISHDQSFYEDIVDKEINLEDYTTLTL